MGEEATPREFSGEIQELGDKLANLTLKQGVELKDYLKEKYGIEPAAAGVAMVAASGAAPGEGEGADQGPTTFDVVLSGAGDKRIQVIKTVREITALGLKEAKALVDAVPKAVKEGLGKEEAEEVKAKLEQQGASVELK